MSTAAMPAGPWPRVSILERLREYVLPLAAISVIFVMLVPLPAAGLDSAAGHVDGRLDHRLSLGDADSPGRRAERLSHLAAVVDALPALAEYRQQPQDSAAWAGGNGGGRQGDRGLRAVCGGRQLRGRLCAVSGADRDSISGGLAWRGAHRRGDGAFHAGCAAGQADGHRRRYERRAD